MTYVDTNLSNFISDNPFTNVASTISSAGLASMPVIIEPDYTWVTLGLLDTADAPETLMVPAFSALLEVNNGCNLHKLF